MSREIQRIHEYCSAKSFPCNRHTYLIGDSTETVKKVSGAFDLVFIDGAHRFPYPIIDWYNLNKMLNVNGILVIDDTDIIGCHILAKYLFSDPGHELLKKHENYAIFRKIESPRSLGDWPSQPFSATKISNNADLLNVLSI